MSSIQNMQEEMAIAKERWEKTDQTMPFEMWLTEQD